MAQFSLSGGDWQFKAFYGEDWRWRNAHKPDTHDTRHWFKGTVPGGVHHDLWQAGEIPDPYFERNSLLLEWIPARTWLYKKQFFVDEALRGKHIQLCFEGVDYAAEFFLNGGSLGTHEGMFTPAIFEVTQQLQYGADNLIAVVIEPAPFEQPQVSRTSRVRTHKSRMTYWWDFCPRMIQVGIWDQVYLNVTEAVRIKDIFVRPQLASNFASAEVMVTTQLNAIETQEVEIEVMLRFDGKLVVAERGHDNLTPGSNTLRQTLHIDQPRLWWTNGAGDQPLYEAEIRIWQGEKELDRRSIRFGIRKIDLIANETDDSTALPYTFVLNGRKTYLKGWNWVPLDVMYGVERPKKLEHLLQLAQRAHVNILRIWGGGLIEKEAFYQRCDELGIMVWQEFIQSSSGIENTPSTNPEFIDLMTREAEQIIPRRRNHPSLVLWGGGNELSDALGQPLDNTHPLLAALKVVVNRLDPDRFWLATSPTGRLFMNSLENIERDSTALHDVHGPWEYQGLTQHYELYNRSTSLLHSEFGVEGVTNLKTLNATIAPAHQLPATLDNPIWQHLGAWWNQQATWQTVFGEISDIPVLVRATQFLQAEGLRYALEADQRRKYQNSGTLPWQFNEPYPMGTCTSAVDYYGQAKPVYYAVAHAYEPLHISAKFPAIAWAGYEQFEAEIWLDNTGEHDFSDLKMEARLIGFGGQVYAEWQQAVSCNVNSATALLNVNWQLPGLKEDLFFLDLQLKDHQGKVVSHNCYPFSHAANLAPLLNIPSTELLLQKHEQGDTWLITLTNTGNYTSFGIWLEDIRTVGAAGYAYFDANHFSLLPGEAKSISVLWCGIPLAERALNISAWNTDLRRL